MELKYAEKGSCGAAEGRKKWSCPPDIHITLFKLGTPLIIYAIQKLFNGYTKLVTLHKKQLWIFKQIPRHKNKYHIIYTKSTETKIKSFDTFE